MYYIRNGLGSGWAWMAGLFALFGMLAGIRHREWRSGV